MNDAYDLLISHARTWAGKTQRPLDPDLLGTALTLRDTHDRVPGTSWPAGSAEYLMTVRWPGHGPLGVPDVDALVATLDTFWRFLRATGRMASGSADPKALAREARRAMPAMRQRCAEPAAYGAAKSMQAYGEEIGISLEGAESIEELNNRLQQITDSWNALPTQERRARTPGPAGAGSAAAQEFISAANALLGGAGLESYVAPGQSAFSGSSDSDDENYAQALASQDPKVVAAQLRSSGFVAAVLRLVDWVGPEGREVTKTGVLRPAVAREAIESLGLDDWIRTTLLREPDEWRSAGDHVGLDRLFMPAVAAGLLEVRGKRVVVGRPWPRAAKEQVISGITLLAGLHRRAEWDGSVQPLVGTMLGMIFADLTSVDRARDWWRTAPTNTFSLTGIDDGISAEDRAELEPVYTHLSDRRFDQMLAYWGDTGIWRESRGRITATELGLDFTRVLINLAMAEVEDDEFDDE